jgi:glycolate oxidase
MYNSASDSVIEELEKIVGSDNLSTRDEEIYCYAQDAALYRYPPDVIVRPLTTEQVSLILKTANNKRIPVTPRGGGTSTCGGPVPVKGGILLDMCSMNKILDVDLDNLTVVVEPGVVCDRLNEELAKHGFFFPPDPASSPACTIGGMVSQNAAGNRAIKYGTTRDHVLWLETALSTGDVINTGSKTLKSVSGFDLTRLFVGSEGSLGVITKIGLKLTPIPEHYSTAFFLYDSIEALAKAAAKIRGARIVPNMLEFMATNTAASSFEYAGMRDLPKGNFLLVDCDGIREAAEKELDKCVSLCKEEAPSYSDRAEDMSYRSGLISARKAALPALARIRPTTCMEDCTVQFSKLPKAAAMIEQIPKKLDVEGVELGNFGHVGDGNMHPTFLFDEREEEQKAAFFKGLDMLYKDIILPLGGSITGEHGIGIIRAPYIELEHGRKAVKMMREIKKLFDPNLILNPGKGKGGPWPLK